MSMSRQENGSLLSRLCYRRLTGLLRKAARSGDSMGKGRRQVSPTGEIKAESNKSK